MISVMSDTNIRAVGCKQYLMAKEPRDNSSYNSKELTISPADLVNFIYMKIIIFSHNFDFHCIQILGTKYRIKPSSTLIAMLHVLNTIKYKTQFCM